MRIPLSFHSDEPLYRQIEAWIRRAIAVGALSPGLRLPSTRALAVELGVSRVTVAAAYAELGTAGLLETRIGSGTRVTDRTARFTPPQEVRDAAAAELNWQRGLTSFQLLAPNTVSAPSSRDLISFRGVADPRSLPVVDLGRALREVLTREGAAALSYGHDPRGDPELRRTIMQLLASQGVEVAADAVLVTAGSQQGLALVCQILVRPGDVVLVEDPTYDHALDLFTNIGASVVSVPTDRDGLLVDHAAAVLEQHPVRMIYTMPTFANPTGASLNLDRRRALVELARRHAVPLFEDDFAADLRYEGRALPTLKALDHAGNVIYAGTFSKLLMPAVRVGYVVADGPVRAALGAAKANHDLGTSLLIQRALQRLMSVGRYQAYVRRTVRTNRHRRDTLVDQLALHLPDSRMVRPRGGLFGWLNLPSVASEEEFEQAARRHGVEVALGSQFRRAASATSGSTDQPAGCSVRLNFATLRPDEITEGVRRLARAASDASGGRVVRASVYVADR